MTVTKQAQRWGPVRRVTLKRNPGTALGVSIVGGKVDIVSGYDGDDTDGKTIYGIFIKNVVPQSPAGKSGDLHTGDRILEVDGVDVRAAQHDRAVQLIKAAGDKVTLTVQSLVSWNSDSSDTTTPPFSPTIHTASKSPARTISQSSTRSPSIRSLKKPAPLPPAAVNGTPEHEIKITVTSEPDSEKEKEPEESKDESSKPMYSDSEESSDEEDERELSGRTYSDKGVEIDRASAANIKRTREEKEKDKEEEDDFGYTMNKIKKKYGPLGETIVVVKLERTAKAGLGLSLAGHRDRTRMAVFVCGMHPAGSAAKAQPPVRVGDEILEVNGIVLHGRCHLNASAIIKGLLGPVFKFILLRRKAALEDVAVKPLTHFPVAIEEDDSERYAGYKGVRDITIKKGPSGLGIMIIEGRHQEAGHGIFVSDLQEGSAAEQAGLNIGDMILAVNKDCLLDVNYDQAAAKLKQTDGVVILTVCSPNLKDDNKVEEGGTSGTDAPPDPSRPTTPRPTPSPAKAEPPADPATAPINPNQDTVIEIATNNEILGVVLLGGSDTKVNGNAAIILDIYKNGAFAKDGRLKPGDQILDCNGVQINKDMVHERMKMTIKQKHPKFRMTVHRPEPLQFEDIEVELNRKAGKVLGLECVAPVTGTGVYIQDLTAGSAADVDGRLQRGDFIAAVDGKDMTGADHLAVAAALKLCGNKTNIKAKRFKTVR